MDPCQKRIPKWAEMAPQKARNDPNMLKIPKIFDFYHEMLILELVYRGSTKDFILIVLNTLETVHTWDSKFFSGVIWLHLGYS